MMSMERRCRSYSGLATASNSGSAAISASFLCRIMTDDLLHGLRAPGAFDDQSETRGGGAQLHGFLRVGVLRAVDDIGPFDQFVEVRRLETEAFFAATVAMYMVQERKLGSYIFRPLVSRRKFSASSGVRNALW
jgi:hypothetical protein